MPRSMTSKPGVDLTHVSERAKRNAPDNDPEQVAENKRLVQRGQEVDRMLTKAGPNTEAQAHIRYEAQPDNPDKPWTLLVRFYNGGNTARVPSEIFTDSYEWLDQALTQVANAVRVQNLRSCSIAIDSKGQPEVLHDEFGNLLVNTI